MTLGWLFRLHNPDFLLDICVLLILFELTEVAAIAYASEQYPFALALPLMKFVTF